MTYDGPTGASRTGSTARPAARPDGRRSAPTTSSARARAAAGATGLGAAARARRPRSCSARRRGSSAAAREHRRGRVVPARAACAVDLTLAARRRRLPRARPHRPDGTFSRLAARPRPPVSAPGRGDRVADAERPRPSRRCGSRSAQAGGGRACGRSGPALPAACSCCGAARRAQRAPDDPRGARVRVPPPRPAVAAATRPSSSRRPARRAVHLQHRSHPMNLTRTLALGLAAAAASPLPAMAAAHRCVFTPGARRAAIRAGRPSTAGPDPVRGHQPRLHVRVAREQRRDRPAA